MSGVWYCVCIPTEIHERKLYSFDTPEEKNKHENQENKGYQNGNILNNNNKISQDSCVIQLNEGKKDDLKKVPLDEDDEDAPLAQLLKQCLNKLEIQDAVWSTNKENTYHQIYFPCGPGLRSDFVLRTLMEKGIGVRSGSTIGVVPCAVFYRDEDLDSDEAISSDEEPETPDPVKTDRKAMHGFKAMQKEFLKSVTARLTVAQVVAGVKAGGTLNFDFLLFACVASMVAALGLMENSSVNIVASMLISPIMGPIMAITFGAVIRDKSLVVTGIKTELLGLSLCLCSGFTFGLIFGNFADNWGSPGPWPTSEMAGRGMTRSLWIGVLVALPSGAGVALSVLGGNSSSLVGVAISASLLPPTVNCGLLWGLSFIKTMKSLREETITFFANGFNITTQPSLVPPINYIPTYYNVMNKECVVLGILSFMLTVVNIACILVSAYVVLKIKEVAPHTSIPKTSRFWKHDIKVARDYNRTFGNNEGEEMGKQFLQEWASLTGVDPKEILSDTQEARLKQLQTLRDIIEDVEADDVYQSVMRCMPSTSAEPGTNPLDLATLQRSGSFPNEAQIPAVWDVNFVPDPSSDKNKPRRKSLMQTIFPSGDPKAEPPKRRKCSKVPSFKSDPMVKRGESENVPGLPSVTERNRMLRRSLQYSDSPFTLWPSQNRRKSLAPRFEVIPVEDIARMRRRSRCPSRDQTTKF
ncbi:uncharacterized protein [Centruroides vittatus]|uniref:uncharacterized protein isoform X3 n=1 Tax=Centruroides vittatus TaxID=120091 RepID=UPI00350F190C